MNTRTMQYIVTIAKEGSISNAARLLYITQPALSRALNAVEKVLGAPLFERHGRRMVPTAIGNIYIEYAERILNLETQMTNQLKKIIQKRCDQVQIAVPMMYASMISNNVFPDFNRRYPFIPVNIYICGSAKISHSMLNGMYRLALAVLDDKMPELFDYNIVGQVEMVVVVSANHPLLQVAQPKEGRTYPCVSIEQLRCYSFAVSEPQNRSYILAKKYFDDHEWMPQIVCQVPYTGYLYNVVANGNCIALVPNIPLDAIDGEPNVRYLCLEDACQLSTLAVIRSRDYILTTYDKELINNIRKQFRHNSLVL